jgi:hypothetical protein
MDRGKMSSPLPHIGPQLEVGSDYVSIDSLVIQNSNLASILLEVEPGERIKKLLEIIGYGTETYQLFSTTAAAEALKSVAIGIASEMTTKKEEIVSGVNQIAQELSSDTGSLSIKVLLENWRKSFGDLLKENFDPTNTQSILFKFDTMIKEKSQSQNSEVMNRLSFDVEDSVVNLLQKNLRDHVTEEFKAMKEELHSIKTKLSVDEAVLEEKNLQANRGNIFEEVIFNLVENLAENKGDIVDNPGIRKTPGFRGNNEGDITVEINQQVTGGSHKLFVFECKLRKKRLSPRALLEEIDKGIANRGAKVGIIITDRTLGVDLDTINFFHEYSNRAILHMDPNEPDPNALRFAYLWARWMCLKDSGRVLDSGVVESALKEIKIAIGNTTTIKKNNTTIQGFLETNSGLADTINDQVTAQIDSLESLILSLGLSETLSED